MPTGTPAPLRKRRHQFQYWRWRREVSHFLDITSGKTGALKGIGVRVPIQIRERQSRAARHDDAHRLIGEPRAGQLAVDHAGTLVGFEQFRSRPPHHQADGVFLVLVGVVQPVAEHGIGFATASRAAAEYFLDRTGQERGLPRLRLPGDIYDGRAPSARSNVRRTHGHPRAHGARSTAMLNRRVATSAVICRRSRQNIGQPFEGLSSFRKAGKRDPVIIR